MEYLKIWGVSRTTHLIFYPSHKFSKGHGFNSHDCQLEIYLFSSHIACCILPFHREVQRLRPALSSMLACYFGHNPKA